MTETPNKNQGMQVNIGKDSVYLPKGLIMTHEVADAINSVATLAKYVSIVRGSTQHPNQVAATRDSLRNSISSVEASRAALSTDVQQILKIDDRLKEAHELLQ